MKPNHPLEGMVVAELGAREAVGVCGSLLAQLGATVIAVESVDVTRAARACRAQFLAGKQSLAYDGGAHADQELLRKLITRADVVLISSDVDIPDFKLDAQQPSNIVCDITAFGGAGPMAGQGLSETQLQALSGIMDTTGPGDGAPVPIGVPVIGYASGVFAASAVLAALRVKRRDGLGQRVEVAMFDTAFVSLNVFLTGVMTGQIADRTRL
ncbi:MAG TPA: CoA transferase, partial [Ramlibacter sp.]|nr:CoA transferase [Ramlibacter sp.]